MVWLWTLWAESLEKLLQWVFFVGRYIDIIMSSRMVYHPLIDSLPQFCTILIWNECVEIGWSCGAEKSGYLLVYTMTSWLFLYLLNMYVIPISDIGDRDAWYFIWLQGKRDTTNMVLFEELFLYSAAWHIIIWCVEYSRYGHFYLLSIQSNRLSSRRLL